MVSLLILPEQFIQLATYANNTVIHKDQSHSSCPQYSIPFKPDLKLNKQMGKIKINKNKSVQVDFTINKTVFNYLSITYPYKLKIYPSL
jgi:hypothetical protein